MQITGEYDAIVTDPPYYDAIPYSDLMDFFYVWLRRSLYGMSPEVDAAFAAPLGPKWDHDAGDGELIDDAAGSVAIKPRRKRTSKTAWRRYFGGAMLLSGRTASWSSSSRTRTRPPGRRWSAR